MNDLVRKNSDENQVEFVKDHVSYWNFIAGEKTVGEEKKTTPYYMCINHALKRICTAQFAMLLHDDRTIELPQDFVSNSIKYMRLRSDIHGLTTEEVQHVIYRTSLHVEGGYLGPDDIDLLKVLRENKDANIISYDPVAKEIDELGEEEDEQNDDSSNEDQEEEEEYGNDIDEEVQDDDEEEGEEEEEHLQQD